ncbi:MAG: UTP--glucose-1-phosphate uridylyltransferase [Micrococcales bacterium]|nr:UTP--glucose-1-phosphate uridylyltransferase [Micrococcales bacterium]
MSEAGLRAAQQAMRAAQVDPVPIDVFTAYYRQLEAGATGLISEASIAPLTDPPRLDAVTVTDDAARAALARTVIIKLNGGLGTSMGLDRAKSLLPVRDGRSFLDLLATQVLAARGIWDARLPLLFLTSFRTHDDTLAALHPYPGLPVDDLPLDVLQSREPKLRADDLTPVSWPADPELEWCPPGHGDVYPALLSAGVLDRLLDAGFAYASVSNSDNLGAGPDARVAGWFAASGAPYAAELCRRTVMDRKGGHLAVRRADGRLVLRDTAQTPADEMDCFTDTDRHPYFHTNNLWWDLAALRATLVERGGVLGLPLIRNVKTVDPTDPTSPQVVQVESAMGAAVEVFAGATAIVVDRSRFLPVKTTDELALLRSDAYAVTADARLRLVVENAPVVELAQAYRTIAGFEERFAHGVPSLRRATSLRVLGDWTFGRDVTVVGDVVLGPSGGVVPDGTVLSGTVDGTPPA